MVSALNKRENMALKHVMYKTFPIREGSGMAITKSTYGSRIQGFLSVAAMRRAE